MSELNGKPIIDRNRISHREAREISVKAMKLAQEMDAARKAEDYDKVDELVKRSDALQFAYVSYVPADWFTEPNITVATPDWWDYLGQGHYEALTQMIRPQKAGEAPN